jgi:DNA-binding HxlR family transcriptional regulator/putative sterol carrier protein
MMTARTYGDGCGIAHALDLVGERWALLIVRELLFGPLRFADLRTGLPGAGPTVLSQRLRELEAAGIVRRRDLPPPAASSVYELTPHGTELGPIVTALGSWALRSPLLPAGPVSAVSAMLTLQTYFRATTKWSATVQIRLGTRQFRARVKSGRLEVTTGQTSPNDAVIHTDPDTFVALLTGRANLTDTIQIEGDRTVIERLIASISMPQAAVQ